MRLDYPSLAPAIAVSNGAQAIAFYQQAFGAVERYRLIDPASGKIGHAEITINGALLMLSDEYPQYNKTPGTLGGVSAKFLVMCDDVDAAFTRAVAAGAEVVVPLTTQFYGHRDGRLRDPFGHEWLLSQKVEEVSPEEMQRRWNAAVPRKPSENG
ncbi:MAG: VOC family protein [Verrucomicrobia bacterium]|nr:VOC family protein [Verrucomicrobiota bacterium]